VDLEGLVGSDISLNLVWIWFGLVGQGVKWQLDHVWVGLSN